MSFSINEAKVEELVRLGYGAYAVPTCLLETGLIENYAPFYAVPLTEWTDPAAHASGLGSELRSLRRKIEESGVPMETPDSLSAEMHGLRRRS